MKKIIILIFSFFFYIASMAGIENMADLTDDERTWLENHKNEKITAYVRGRETLWFYTDREGNMHGRAYDIIKTLREQLGMDIEVKQLYNFEADRLEKEDKPGLYFGMTDTDVKKSDHTVQFFSDKLIVVKRIGDRIYKLRDLQGKKVGFLEDAGVYEKTKRIIGENFLRPMILKTREGADKLLEMGEIDAYVDEFERTFEYNMDIDTKKMEAAFVIPQIGSNKYIGISKEYKPVTGILESVLNLYEKSDLKEINQKELEEYVKAKFKLSKEERDYLRNIKKLKVLLYWQEDGFPYYYQDKNGHFKGVVVKLMNAVENVFDLKVEYIIPKEGESFDNYPGDWDIYPFIIRNGSAKGNFLSGAPFYEFPMVAYNRDEEVFINSLHEFEGKKVAVVKNYIVESYLENNYINSKLIKYDNFDQVVNGVRKGEADFFIGDIIGVRHSLLKNNINDIKIAGLLEDRMSLSFGYPKNKEMLFKIIQKLTDKISFSKNVFHEKLLKKDNTITKDYKVSITLVIVVIISYLIIYRHFKKVKTTEKKLEKLTYSLVATFEDINHLADNTTGIHVKRMSTFSELLAEKAGCSSKLARDIGIYSSLHDLGKLSIPDEILKKPGKLTDEEFEIVKTHVESGYGIIKKLDLSDIAENIVRYHHERWDGRGYIKGLKGEEIPIEARVVAITDVYDALRQDRPYKESYSHEKSIRIIKEGRGTQFDPRLTDIFIENHTIFEELYKKNSL